MNRHEGYCSTPEEGGKARCRSRKNLEIKDQGRQIGISLSLDVQIAQFPNHVIQKHCGQSPGGPVISSGRTKKAGAFIAPADAHYRKPNAMLCFG